MRTLPLFCTLLAAPLAAQAFPLLATTGDTTATEGSAPFLVPTRVQQTRLVDRNTLNAQGLPATFANWDMVTFDATGRFVFVPAEVGSGAGVFRYDTVTKTFVTLLVGDGTGVRAANPATFNAANSDYARLDPCTPTPWGTILTGEETTGGRLFEITNPLDATGPYHTRWLSKVPAMSHEGVRFDRDGNLYTIDEDNSGSIYKFVPATPGDLTVGQTFVLSADAFAADPTTDASQSWSATVNRPADQKRFGMATWVPLTDAVGNALTVADPFVYVTATGGRAAADEVKGTPYGRPEDMTFNTLANGNEALYVNLTSENRTVSIELVSASKAIVREFVNFDTINLATGSDVNPLQNDPWTNVGPGTTFESPDNLATDAFGSIYIVEDNNPGDIWKAIDANKDGVAEAIGLFVSLGVAGSEPTGLDVDPTNPYRFIVSIQHPSSGNDALWLFDTRPYAGSTADFQLASGVNAAPRTGPAEFVKDASSGDSILFNVSSPNGSYNYAPYALLLQPFVTANRPAPFLPPLWISPFQPIVVLNGGYAGGFQFVLPAGGTTTALKVPTSLAGYSALVQGLAVSPLNALVTTDAHEIVLH